MDQNCKYLILLHTATRIML